MRQLDRRPFLTGLLAAWSGTSLLGSGTHAADPPEDVSWLGEVNTPPEDATAENPGRLEPLLRDAEGEPITTLDGWKAERRRLRRRWMEFLGPMPEKRPAPELETLRVDRTDDFVRTLVRFESEPGVPVEGYLLQPHGRAPRGGRPGLCALHATTTDTIERIAGLTGNPTRQIAPKLCRAGFVVFCPRNFLWQDVKSYREAVERFRKRHPQTLGMHKMLFDAQRGVDVLESLADVNAKRLGAVGHSLGAKETLYLQAFDERIRAGVASEGGLGFRSTNWNAAWYLGKAIDDPEFPLNHHQLIALIAPRPFLVLAGEQGRGAADGKRSWPLIEPALPVYRLYGEPPRVGLYNHGQGHDIPEKAFRRMREWLETYV